MPEETVDVTIDITDEGAAALGEQLVHAFDARRAQPAIQGRDYDDKWEFTDGWAWVFRAPGKETLTKPVIIADGFGPAESKLEEWAGLWDESGIADEHPWGTQLHGRERDVIVLGYKSRNVAIATNAAVATACILRANAEKSTETPLVVGGLSMGGLVTRLALAQMTPEEHDTATYFSYDSPHLGAWIPISLQKFAHGLAKLGDQFEEPKKSQLKALSNLINSPAARELLWRHTNVLIGGGPTFPADPTRKTFLDALAAAGDWPNVKRKVGVANGRGDGQGDPSTIEGELNLDWPTSLTEPPPPKSPGAKLYTQAAGDDKLVATLSAGFVNVKTTGIPALDGAPGGMLDSFGLAHEALATEFPDATVKHPNVCFVPVASAVALTEPSAPYEPIPEQSDASGLDAYKVASQNERHTLLTEELCDWLTEEFDRV